jgi:hypothetical protein
MDSRVVTISLDELEELIRRVVREELDRLKTGMTGEVTYLEDDSPLYQDMLELKRQKEAGELSIQNSSFSNRRPP